MYPHSAALIQQACYPHNLLLVKLRCDVEVSGPPREVRGEALAQSILLITQTRLFKLRWTAGAGGLVGQDFIQKLTGLPSPSADEGSSGSRGVFVQFVFEAVREIIVETYSCENETQNPMWMKQKPIQKSIMSTPKTEDHLRSLVDKELMILFGFERRSAKENLIVRWSPQKRRDRVDQILVRELHSEEVSWTDFSHDETLVKDSISNSIMDLLINDTVETLKRAYSQK